MPTLFPAIVINTLTCDFKNASPNLHFLILHVLREAKPREWTGRWPSPPGLPTAAALSQAMWRRASLRFPANERDTLLSLGEGVVNCDIYATSHLAPSAWTSEVWGNLRWSSRVLAGAPLTSC